MSVELHVIFNEARLPDAQQWQDEITSLGFDLQLDPVADLPRHSGFLPATTRGAQSGFEFDVFPAKEIVAGYPQLASRAAGCDFSANFRFGGDLTEMACAMAASSALAKLTNGIWFDPQGTEALYSIDDAIAQARLAFDPINEAKQLQNDQPPHRTGAARKRSWFQKLFGWIVGR